MGSPSIEVMPFVNGERERASMFLIKDNALGQLQIFSYSRMKAVQWTVDHSMAMIIMLKMATLNTFENTSVNLLAKKSEHNFQEKNFAVNINLITF